MEATRRSQRSHKSVAAAWRALPKATDDLCSRSRETIILKSIRTAGRRFGAIALLAILVRAIVPGGYMLAAADTPDGRFVILQLCDAHGQPASALNLDTGELVDMADVPLKKSPGGSPDNQPCAFASASAVTVPDVPGILVAVFEASKADLPAVAYVQPGRGIPAPPPPSTGPPSLI